MKFIERNIQPLVKVNSFDLSQFNRAFQETKYISTANPRQDVNMRPTRAIVDPELSRGKNWYNPYEKDYINPHTPDPQRLALFVLINKYEKRVLVIKTKGPYEYILPGGFPKIFETNENASARYFQEQTQLPIKPDKVVELLKPQSYDRMKAITTHMAFGFQEPVKPRAIRRPNLKWIDLRELQYYKNQILAEYYNLIYLQLVQYLY